MWDHDAARQRGRALPRGLCWHLSLAHLRRLSTHPRLSGQRTPPCAERGQAGLRPDCSPSATKGLGSALAGSPLPASSSLRALSCGRHSDPRGFGHAGAEAEVRPQACTGNTVLLEMPAMPVLLGTPATPRSGHPVDSKMLQSQAALFPAPKERAPPAGLAHNPEDPVQGSPGP